MSTPARVLSALAALLAVSGAGLWLLLPGSGEQATADVSVLAPDVPMGGGEEATPHPAPSALAAATASHHRVEAPESGTLTDEPLFPATRPKGTLHGITLDIEGRPLPGAELVLQSHAGRCPPGQTVGDDRKVRRPATSKERGEFAFEALPAGPYLLAAALTDGRRARVEFALHEGQWPEPLRVVLRAPAAEDGFAVVVVDAQDQPVAGAQVTVVGGVDGLGVVGQGRLPAMTGVSDATGRCVFADRHMTGAVAIARAADGRLGRASVYPRGSVAEAMAQGGLRVRLAAPAALIGNVTGVPAERLEGLRVLARAMNTDRPWSVLTYGITESAPIERGSFAFAGLAAGSYTLSIETRTGLRLLLPQENAGQAPVANSIALPKATLLPGQTTRCDLLAAVGGTLRGVVVTDQRRPVAHAEVRTFFGPRGINHVATQVQDGVRVQPMNYDTLPLSGHPDTHLSARTAADGTYQLDGLQPGTHCVEVFANGLSTDSRTEVQVTDGRVTDLEHVLEPAGVIQGVMRPGGSITAKRAREPRPRILAMVAQDSGLFTLPGLPAGSYDLSEGGLVLATGVEVQAGRATWVDLVMGARFQLSGVLRDEFGAVAGAMVRAMGNVVRTGGDGRFELRLGQSPYEGVRAQVDLDGLRYVFLFRAFTAPLTSAEVEARLGNAALAVELADADGRPIAHAFQVRSQALAAGTGGILEPSLCTTGADGQRALSRLWPGTYEVHARFADGAEVRRTVQVPAMDRVVLRAPATGTLAVTVLDAAGRPMPGVRVTAVAWDGQGAMPKVPANANAEAARQREALDALERMGRARRGERVPEGRAPDGRAPDGPAPPLRRDAGNQKPPAQQPELRQSSQTDPQGRAVLRPLPVGDYVVFVTARGKDAAQLRAEPQRARVWRDQTAELRISMTGTPR